jgi:hypothetical protein
LRVFQLALLELLASTRLWRIKAFNRFCTPTLTLHNRYVSMAPKVLEFYETRHCNSAVKMGE